MATLFGLKTCDTCRRARRWLGEHGPDVDYRDVRADGLDAATLERWFRQAPWSTLVNRRSKTWRDIPESQRAGLDRDGALKLLIEHPTLLKRPVLEIDGELVVGFDEERYRELAADR